jgi:hypothetical protein
MERNIKSAYAVSATNSPNKLLVSQSAKGRFSTVNDKVRDDDYVKIPEDKTEISPELEAVLEAVTKDDRSKALAEYKAKEGMIGGKKSKTRRRKFRLTKKKNKNKRRSQKKI